MKLNCLLPTCLRPPGGKGDESPAPPPEAASPPSGATGALAGLPRRTSAHAEAARRPGASGEATPALQAPAPEGGHVHAGVHIQEGMVLKGLSRLLDGGGVVGGDAGEVNKGIKGSYTQNGHELTFRADDSGTHEINILPYVAGAISYAPMKGRETISGQFTGCTMAIYNAGGETRVNHVDTAPDDTGVAPSKIRWARMKEQGLEIAAELPTTGMLGQFLDSHPLDESFATLSVLAVASPVAGISSHFVVKKDGEYTVVG